MECALTPVMYPPELQNTLKASVAMLSKGGSTNVSEDDVEPTDRSYTPRSAPPVPTLSSMSIILIKYEHTKKGL